METIVENAQLLVYSLLGLMPSLYQRESLEAQLGLFLEAQGHPLPQHTQLKSASSLSRFLNQYVWSTLSVIRTTRKSVLQQIEAHLPHLGSTLYLLIDLTTLPKTGKFPALSTAIPSPAESDDLSDSADAAASDPWVRVLNGKRGLHLVMLYLVIGQWRVPWSFKIWRGKGHPSPNQLACKLLATVPRSLTCRFKTVVVLADTEFGTPKFTDAVQARQWRAVVGIKSDRKLSDGRSVKDLYRHAKRGAQVQVAGFACPLTLSWFWLKRADGKRELRFVASTHPYSGVYLVRLGRHRWAIVACFPQGGLFQNHQASLWLPSLWSVYSLRGLSLVDSLSDCLSPRSLDQSMVSAACFGLAERGSTCLENFTPHCRLEAITCSYPNSSGYRGSIWL